MFLTFYEIENSNRRAMPSADPKPPGFVVPDATPAGFPNAARLFAEFEDALLRTDHAPFKLPA